MRISQLLYLFLRINEPLSEDKTISEKGLVQAER